MVCGGYRDPKQLRDLGLLYAAVVSGKDFFSTQLGKTDPILPSWVELFEFNPNRHDYGDKTFLGHRIAGRGLAEVDEALDILSRAPATSRFISRKLALFFVSDHPPAALIDPPGAAMPGWAKSTLAP